MSGTVPPPGSDLVTIPQACRDLLGISDTTGYALARAGEFPGDAAFQVGAQWRVSVPRLQRFLHGDLDVSGRPAGTSTSAAASSGDGGKGPLAARPDQTTTKNADTGRRNSRLSA